MVGALMLALACTIGQVQTSTVGEGSCVGVCDAYRTEMYQWRKVAKELADENGALLIAKAMFEAALTRCMEKPDPICPSILPWASGSGAVGALLGALAAGYVCHSR